MPEYHYRTSKTDHRYRRRVETRTRNRAHLGIREHRKIPLEHALRERHLSRDQISHTGDEDNVRGGRRLGDVEESRGDLGSEDVDGEEIGLAEFDERVGSVDEGTELREGRKQMMNGRR